MVKGVRRTVTLRAMVRFIYKHLPECGVFHTADLFREKFEVDGISTYNDTFCILLETVASYCRGSIYDPTYIKMAFEILRDPEHRETAETLGWTQELRVMDLLQRGTL